MTDPAGLRLEALRTWLATNVPEVDVRSELIPSLLAGGRSNVSYILTDASGQRFVLRRPPLGNLMPSAHDMKREFQVLHGLNSVHFPTPRVISFCDDADVIGAPFVLMEFVDGNVIDTEFESRKLAPKQTDSLSSNLVSALSTLHSIAPAHAGLDNLGRPDGYLQRQAKRWGEQWTLTKTRDLPEILQLHEWLTKSLAALPTDLPSSIVHGDFRIDNVIVNPTSFDIRAVLDWEMATLGDPVSDLAISLVYWSQPSDTLRAQVPVAQHVTDAPGFWTRSQIVNEYSALTGFGLDHLDVCVALACFKLAVIMESIRKRAMSGQQLGEASHDVETMGLATIALTTLGLTVIESDAITALNS